MKTFEEFIFEKVHPSDENNFLSFLFSMSYNKAIRHFKKLHEKITEDHVLEFINHYMLNNYGVDVNHSPDIFRYVKSHLHSRFLKKKDDVNEGWFTKKEKKEKEKTLHDWMYMKKGEPEMEFTEEENKKFQNQLLKLMKRVRLDSVHKKLDPYGEEKWEDENEQYNELDPYGEENWFENYDNLTVDQLINLPYGDLENYIRNLKTRKQRFNTMLILKDIMSEKEWKNFTFNIKGLSILNGY